MSTVVTSLVEVDGAGVARIGGTKVKVIEIALDKLVHGSSPEEICLQFPHLSLAQVHAALSYYYEHQAELDAEIERRWREVNEFAGQEPDSPFRQRLLALKKQT